MVNFAVFDQNGAPVAINNDGIGTKIPYNEHSSSNEFYRTGYSCLGITLAIVTGCLLLFLGLIDDLRPLPPTMPLVKTRSTAILAASQSTYLDPKELVLKRLKWGVLHRQDGISYHGFADGMSSVESPQEGELVASISHVSPSGHACRECRRLQKTYDSRELSTFGKVRPLTEIRQILNSTFHLDLI